MVGTTPGLSQQHCHSGGNQGSDLKKKLRERKNAVEQQAGGETEEEEDRQIREV